MLTVVVNAFSPARSVSMTKLYRIVSSYVHVLYCILFTFGGFLIKQMRIHGNIFGIMICKEEEGKKTPHLIGKPHGTLVGEKSARCHGG